MTTPKPDDVELDQLPEPQRRYIDDTEIGELREKGFRIYEGKKGGTYIDATAEWIDNHAQKGHELITDPKSPFVGLVPHPEHGENVYEYANGEQATHQQAPRNMEQTADGSTPFMHQRLPKKKDKLGNPVIVEQKEALNHGDKKIPADAVDVYVALDKDAPVQAKWRHPETRKLSTSYSPAYAKEKKEKHWREYQANKPDIQKGIRKLRNMDVDQLKASPPDTCLALVGLLGIRHGGEARTHDDGELTGMGALDLRKGDVRVGDIGMTLVFRGKHNRPLRFTKRNKKIAEAMTHHMEDKKLSDKIFDTSTARNRKRFKELAGNDKVKVKDLRTDYANYIAGEAVKQNPPPSNMSERAFKTWQNQIGLEVGKALGHFKEETRKNKQGKIMYEEDGKTAKKHWVNTSNEAINSYIDPQFWDEYKPKQDIQNAHTPDWHEKTPMEERDIDEYAEARRRKGENRQWGIREFGGQRKPLVKTWMQSLSEQGFTIPVIKQTTAHQIWFLNNGVDYVGTFGLNGDVFIEKAVFKPTFNPPGISYNPAGRNRSSKPKEENKDVQTLNFDELDGL